MTVNKLHDNKVKDNYVVKNQNTCIFSLTDKVISCDEYAAKEEDSGGDSVVHPEHHVVNDGFVDQVADLDEARHRGHHSKDRHLEFLCLQTITETNKPARLNPENKGTKYTSTDDAPSSDKWHTHHLN